MQDRNDNAPTAVGEVFVTRLGGLIAFDNAIGLTRESTSGTRDPELLFSDTLDLEIGDTVSTGEVGAAERLGLFILSDAGRNEPGLAAIGLADLLLRYPATGDDGHVWDDVPPEPVRLDGTAPAASTTRCRHCPVAG